MRTKPIRFQDTKEHPITVHPQHIVAMFVFSDDKNMTVVHLSSGLKFVAKGTIDTLTEMWEDAM